MIAQNTTPAQARDSYPLDFSIHNPFHGEGLPVLFILSDVTKHAKQQKWNVSIKKTISHELTFKGLSEKPGPEQFHWAFTFRSGTLHSHTLKRLQAVLQTALMNQMEAVQPAVSDPVVSNAEQSISWYIAFKNDLVPGTGKKIEWPLSLELDGMVAAPGTGSRSSQVEIKFDNLYLADAKHPVSFSRSKHLDIVNHRGSSHAPLHFGVLGADRLLNNTSLNQQLTVFFETIGREPVTFSKETVFELAIPYDDEHSKFGHLGKKNEVEGIHLKLPENHENFEYHWAPFAVVDPRDDKNGQIIFPVEVAKDENNKPILGPFITGSFELSQIQPSGSAGTMNIVVHVRNLPGYWDSSFQIPIHKESTIEALKLVSKGDLMVEGKATLKKGLTTSQIISEGDLTVEGKTTLGKNIILEDDRVKLPYPTSGYGLLIGKDTPYRKEGKQLPAGHAGLYITLKEEHHNIWPLVIADHVGNPIFRVEIDGEVSAAKRFRDKTGEVMPVGTIVAYGGSTAPTGWLLCNGQAIDSTIHSDLYNVIGGTVPDLRDRFITGAGKEYELNDTGGSATHILTYPEMPRHRHQFRGYKKQTGNISSGGSAISSPDIFKWSETEITKLEGGSKPHNNLPPYYALTYIIKY